MVVSVQAEESCGLWPAVTSLGTSRKIKSGLQEGIKLPHTTFEGSVWARRGVSPCHKVTGCEPSVLGVLGHPLAPVAVQVMVPGIGSRDEVTFPLPGQLEFGLAGSCHVCHALGDFLCIP